MPGFVVQMDVCNRWNETKCWKMGPRALFRGSFVGAPEDGPVLGVETGM